MGEQKKNDSFAERRCRSNVGDFVLIFYKILVVLLYKTDNFFKVLIRETSCSNRYKSFGSQLSDFFFV